jgi:hypothetical protein
METCFQTTPYTKVHRMETRFQTTHLPGLTTAALRRYDPFSEATASGHLDHIRAGLKSSKQTYCYDEGTAD